MKKEKDKQYIYIVQAHLEPSKCKIGRTDNLDRRLKEYNSITGKSKENIYQYLFSCEVSDMALLEKDIKEEFSIQREEKSREIYFYNSALFELYVNFIKSHKLFVEEIFLKTEEKPTVKEVIVKRTTPTLKERGLSRRDVMEKPKKVKDDEFYTRYEDIEKEITMYDKNTWKNKTVFCNCDDAVGDDERNTSAFALYFLKNFKELGLEKLICTHYGGGIDLFNEGVKGYVFTKDGFHEIGKKVYPPRYSGSFDDPLSLKILNEQADIVCTNPPFSKARDFWKIVIDSGKKFLIISNIANVKNDAYIPYFVKNKVWAGYNSVDWYLNPRKQLTAAAGHWYTNFPIKDRPKYKNLKIVPLNEIPEQYKEYDDYKTLIVKNSFIPSDYKKPFAVSVRQILNGLLEKGYKIVQQKQYRPFVNGKEIFAKVLVQKDI